MIDDIASHFGSQVCVVAIDAKQTADGWKCYLNGGRKETDRNLFEWAREANERGAGEILFTSMDHDGVKNGYANDALSQLSEILTIPVSLREEQEARNTLEMLLLSEKRMQH